MAFLGALSGFFYMISGILKLLKPQQVQEGEQLGRAQANLADVLAAERASRAELQAEVTGPHTVTETEQLLDQGKF